jgi:hypothetical protein
MSAAQASELTHPTRSGSWIKSAGSPESGRSSSVWRLLHPLPFIDAGSLDHRFCVQRRILAARSFACHAGAAVRHTTILGFAVVSALLAGTLAVPLAIKIPQQGPNDTVFMN